MFELASGVRAAATELVVLEDVLVHLDTLRARARWAVEYDGYAVPPGVITSYSIHYTKLYDGHIERDDPDLTDRQRDVFEALVALHGIRARPVGSETIARQGGLRLSSRITSYNVCYTKLLRY